jgi:hypothetical protein
MWRAGGLAGRRYKCFMGFSQGAPSFGQPTARQSCSQCPQVTTPGRTSVAGCDMGTESGAPPGIPRGTMWRAGGLAGRRYKRFMEFPARRPQLPQPTPRSLDNHLFSLRFSRQDGQKTGQNTPNCLFLLALQPLDQGRVFLCEGCPRPPDAWSYCE